MRTRYRVVLDGATYHVYSRGVDRRRIFVDEEDYRLYIALLAAICERKGWRLLVFCLMPNHVHLLIEAPETNLGEGMQWLHSRYAIAFNQRHCRTGHLFENRFKSPLVRTDGEFVRLIGYINANPVAAQLCRRAREWPWGSHAIVDGVAGVPEWLAHERLVERLDDIVLPGSYARIVATAEGARP